MPNEFTADDIFKMAVKIEENGAVFYRNAAKSVTEKKHKDFLYELADMEDEHAVVFSDMHKELNENETAPAAFDPDNENVLYLKALADTRVFFKKEQPDDNFQSILSTAIQTEKDSIAFYLGMKELVSKKSGRSKIDDIIKEEMNHIRLLSGKLIEQQP